MASSFSGFIIDTLALLLLLALALLATNTLALQGLTLLGVPLLAAKILVELALIPVSFSAQKRWVFAKHPPAAPLPSQAERKMGAESVAPSLLASSMPTSGV